MTESARGHVYVGGLVGHNANREGVPYPERAHKPASVWAGL